MSDYRLDDELLLAVRAARPAVPEEAVSRSGLAATAIVERVLASDRRRRRGRATARWRIALPGLVPAISAIVVVIVVAVVFLSLRSGGSPGPAASSARGVELVYVAGPTAQFPHVTSAALGRTVADMQSRVDALGLSGASVRVVGGDEIAVRVPNENRQQLAGLVASTARLAFYDWEANVLMPSGQTVASQLQAASRTALEISQGASSAAPGEPNAGGVPLYQAVKLAAQQPKSVRPDNARLGPQYYMFGAPGSAACAAEARQEGTIVTAAGQHCLLAGPENQPYSTSYRRAVQNLARQLPPGVSVAEGEVVVVQQGTVVLQAANPSARHQIAFLSRSAQFFVLRDSAALTGSDITNPQESTDQSGQPNVTFGFNSAGRSAFHHVTRQVSQRGNLVSTTGAHYNQHFAVALDGQLLTVPSIDYQVYPEGIAGDGGADITDGFTTRSAKDLAIQLRYGPLPLQLRLVRERPSA